MHTASPITLAATGKDGHRTEARLYLATSPDAPVVLFLPALGTLSRFYGRFAHAKANHGISVCTPDWRGMGSSSVRASRRHPFGYRELIEIDAPAMMATLVERCPAAQLWLGGHSLGGQVAALVAAANRDRTHGLITIASGTVHTPCYPFRLRAGIRTLGTLIACSRPLSGHFPGKQIGFGGRESHGVMRDWLHTARYGTYAPHGSTEDYEALLRNFDRPALSLNFAGDSWAPAAIGRMLLDKMPLSRSQLWHWTSSESAGQALDHFSWARQPELVAPRVSEWMKQSSATSS